MAAGCYNTLLQRVVDLESRIKRMVAESYLQFNCCVVDGDDVGVRGEDGSAQLDFCADRLLLAISELHERGYANVICYTSHDVESHLSKFPALDVAHLIWKQAQSYTINDLLECAMRYRCPFITSYDVSALDHPWKLPCDVREWLKSYGSSMQVQFRWNAFGHFGVRHCQQVEEVATAAMKSADSDISERRSAQPVGESVLPPPAPSIPPLAEGDAPASIAVGRRPVSGHVDEASGNSKREVQPQPKSHVVTRSVPPPPPSHPPAHHVRSQVPPAQASSATPAREQAQAVSELPSVAKTEDYCLKLVEYNGQRLVCFFLARDAVSNGMAPFAIELSNNVFGDAQLVEHEDAHIPQLKAAPAWMAVTCQIVEVTSGQFCGLKAVGMASNAKCRKRAGRLAISIAALTTVPPRPMVLPQDAACDVVLKGLVSQVREGLSSQPGFPTEHQTPDSQPPCRAPERGRSLSRVVPQPPGSPPNACLQVAPPPPPGKPPEKTARPPPPPPCSSRIYTQVETRAAEEQAQTASSSERRSKSAVSAWLDSSDVSEVPPSENLQNHAPPDTKKRMNFDSLRAPSRSPASSGRPPQIQPAQPAVARELPRIPSRYDELNSSVLSSERIPLEMGQMVTVIARHDSENPGYLSLLEGNRVRIECCQAERGTDQDTFPYYAYGAVVADSSSNFQEIEGWFPFDKDIVEWTDEVDRGPAGS